MANRFAVALLLVACCITPIHGMRFPGLKIVVDCGGLPIWQRLIFRPAGSVAALDPQKLPLAERTSETTEVRLPDVPFDLWYLPKNPGLPVRVAAGQTPRDYLDQPIRLEKWLGGIELRGDDLPRLRRIVVTEEKDAGPGAKGHRPIQVGDSYRTVLVLPEGNYAVWIEPANGARANRAFDRVKVQAGKVELLD